MPNWIPAATLPLLLAVSCGDGQEEVFRTVEFSFEAPQSEVREDAGVHGIDVVLNTPSERRVLVEYSLIDGSASGHDKCRSRDYLAASGKLTFEPGQTKAHISIDISQDSLAEADEDFTVVLDKATGANEGRYGAHSVRLLDDDRRKFFDVTDFGATGGGDVTAELTAAIEAAAAERGAVVFFPEGVYEASALRFAPGVTYVGYGAELRATTDTPLEAPFLSALGESMADTAPLVLQGFVVNGNRGARGPFTDSAQDGSPLIRLSASSETPGRLIATLEDLHLFEGGGDGLEVRENVEATVCDLSGQDIWRDVIALRGGNTDLSVHGALADGEEGSTGIWVGSRNPGYGDSLRAEVMLDEIELLDGDFEIGLQGGSNLTARHIFMSRGPTTLSAADSQVTISDSTLVFGPAGDRFNWFRAPTNVLIERSRLLYTDDNVSEGPTERLPQPAILNVDYQSYPVEPEEGEPTTPVERSGQRLVLDSCSFGLAADVRQPGPIAAVSATGGGKDNRVELIAPSFGPRIVGPLHEECQGCIP